MSGSLHACRVFLVTGDIFLRQGLTGFLQSRDDLTVCGFTDSSLNLAASLGAARPDLVIVDVGLKDCDGVELIGKLTGAHPSIKILATSELGESVHALACFRAGAKGYIGTDARPNELSAAIDAVLAGQLFVRASFYQKVLIDAIRNEPATATNGNGHVARASFEIRLSARESEVLNAMRRGLATPQIARQLKLSPKTIETYRGQLKIKLRVRTSRELIDARLVP